MQREISTNAKEAILQFPASGACEQRGEGREEKKRAFAENP